MITMTNGNDTIQVTPEQAYQAILDGYLPMYY